MKQYKPGSEVDEKTLARFNKEVKLKPDELWGEALKRSNEELIRVLAMPTVKLLRVWRKGERDSGVRQVLLIEQMVIIKIQAVLEEERNRDRN